MRKTVPLGLCAALLCAAILAAAPAAEKKDRNTAPPLVIPPPAQPLTVQVRRGETAEVALRIFGQKNEALKYLVRTEPRHGKVTAPKVAGREVSTVVYTPPADLEITRDRFTYAVQSSAGVSAAVEVLIAITDLPPELALPGAQDFGAMLAGQTASRPLEIRNRGGGRAEGKLEVGEPWKIEGSPAYRLGAGERAIFKVVFAPAVGGDFENAVRFTSQPETSVLVRGSALAALAAVPAKVTLQNAVGDPVRAGTFELTNQTDAERRARLSGGERLALPAEVMVPAQGRVSVTVQTAATDVAALSGEVRVESDGLTLRVPVVAPVLGGIVRAMRPAVAFGRVAAALSAGASFELENIGGAPARVSWEIAAPFTTEETGALLAPGEKKVLALRTQPAKPGKYRAWLAVACEQQKLEFPVEAELLPAAAPGPALLRASSEPGPEPVADPAPVETPAQLAAATFPEDMRITLLVPAGVRLTRLEATHATLEWPAALSEAGRFRFERRRVVLDPAGGLKALWEELPGVAVQRTGQTWTARFSKLRGGEVYGVRVVPITPGAEPGKPLFAQFFNTPPAPKILPKITPLRVLLVVLAVCGALIFRQRRAQRARR